MTTVDAPVPAAQPDPMLRVRQLGQCAYEPVWREMQQFTQNRDESTADEAWVLEHPPVYTLGLNGKGHHVLNTGEIPVVKVDRGGQVTYHGPGQVVIYLLLDLQRRGMGVRELVDHMERAVIEYLAALDIRAQSRSDAPGVYVDGAKIAALGLRVRRGRCYHGLSFNVDMDLAPFAGINPCGYEGMPVTQLRDLVGRAEPQSVATSLTSYLARQLGYILTR